MSFRTNPAARFPSWLLCLTTRNSNERAPNMNDALYTLHAFIHSWQGFQKGQCDDMGRSERRCMRCYFRTK